MKTLHTVRNLFARSSLAAYLSDAFRTKHPHTSHLHDRKIPKRLDFSMEAVEPRLLLSAAPIDYSTASATDFTLTAIDATHVSLDGGSYSSGAIALDSTGELNIFRNSVAGALVGDTIHLNLTSLDQLSTGLKINFTGGSQDLISDSVILSGTGSFDHDFSINSDADITVAVGASLTATGHAVTLAVDATDTGLPPVSDNKFYANADADIDVYGDISADKVSLSASATIDVSNSSLGLGPLQLAFIYANVDASVNVGTGADISGGELDINAFSDVKAVANMASLNSKSDASTDAAVASVIITSNTTARISGNAVVDVSDAFTLVAKTDSLAAALADGSKGGAGATLGLAVITGNTEASVSGGASVRAGSISIGAERSNDATALAKSTTGGATKSSTPQDSEKALSENKAQTSDGSVSLAGAVAVGTVVSHTKAFVDSTALVTSTGALDILAKSVTSSQTLADGSATVANSTAGSDGNGNVGIAVGIGVGDLHNDAYAGGTSISAGSLSVQALMAEQDRTLDFVGADVNDTKDSITLAGGAHGLKTGDALVYHEGSAAITGLVDGTNFHESRPTPRMMKET